MVLNFRIWKHITILKRRRPLNARAHRTRVDGFALLFNVLAEGGLPVKFDIEARFKRPIFWDDELKLN